MAAPMDARADAEGRVGNFYVYDLVGILVQFGSG
jgi:hypothetical protein